LQTSEGVLPMKKLVIGAVIAAVVYKF